MTLADKETNLILTDKVNRVIQGNVAMQVTEPGELLGTLEVMSPDDQIRKCIIWWVNLELFAVSATWWSKLKPIGFNFPFY